MRRNFILIYFYNFLWAALRTWNFITSNLILWNDNLEKRIAEAVAKPFWARTHVYLNAEQRRNIYPLKEVTNVCSILSKHRGDQIFFHAQVTFVGVGETRIIRLGQRIFCMHPLLYWIVKPHYYISLSFDRAKWRTHKIFTSLPTINFGIYYSQKNSLKFYPFIRLNRHCPRQEVADSGNSISKSTSFMPPLKP